MRQIFGLLPLNCQNFASGEAASCHEKRVADTCRVHYSIRASGRNAIMQSGVIQRSAASRHGHVPRRGRHRRSPGQVTQALPKLRAAGSVFVLCELITVRTSASGKPETRASSAKVDPFFRALIIWEASIH